MHEVGPAIDNTWTATLNRSAAPLSVGSTRVELIYHGYALRHADNQPHRHSFFEVCLVADGAGRFIVDNQPHAIDRGDVFVARPGVVHQITSRSRPQMELYWISYQLHQSQRVADDLHALLDRFALSSVLIARDDGRCAALWQALRALASGPNMIGLADQIAWLTGGLITAIAQVIAPGASPSDRLVDSATRLMAQALRYIDDNLSRRLSPGEVADQIGLSQRHFTRLFSAHTGGTFAAYVTQARVDRALARLRHSNAPIKTIAADVGFADVHYFGRVFARTVGASPTEIRDGAQPVRSRPRHGEFV